MCFLKVKKISHKESRDKMGKVLGIGECMIRLSSQRGQRLLNSTQLDLTYGGAEANVMANLAQLKHKTKFASKIPDNSMSHNLVRHFRGMGVDCDPIVYGGDRLGSYFVEVGTGLRPSSVIYDRAYSSISMMEEIEWDLDELFEDVTLLHITGITLGLSKAWHDLGVEIIKAAKERDIKISFDMNYRQKMWSHEEARSVYEKVLPFVDYLNAGKLDAIHFMDSDEVEEEPGCWQYYMKHIASKYPNIKFLYGTNRHMITPNSYKMSGYIWDTGEQKAYESKEYRMDTVVDRIGAGDSFAAGILHGFIEENPLQEVVEFGMAASVLKHTVSGDVNLFSLSEIENFMVNTSNVIR